MKTAFARLCALALGICVAVGAAAQDQRSDKTLSSDDREFIAKAGQDVLAATELGKLAQKKASSEDVKKFGQRMIADRDKIGRELDAVAAKLGVTLPKNPSEKQQGDVKNFASLSGANFDREYSWHMVEAQDEAITLFEKQAKSGDSEELKSFAEKTLPVLREHMKMARALKKPVT